MIARVEGGGSGVRFPNIQRLATALEIDPAELFMPPELTRGGLRRAGLAKLTARLAGLSDSDLVWVADLIEVALKSRR